MRSVASMQRLDPYRKSAQGPRADRHRAFAQIYRPSGAARAD